MGFGDSILYQPVCRPALFFDRQKDLDKKYVY